MKRNDRTPELSRHLVLSATSAALLVLAVSKASACGTFEVWIQQRAQRSVQDVLMHLECVHYNTYDPERHAILLFELMRDAVVAGPAPEEARRLFHKYECLPSMKTREGYSEVLTALGAERCTPEGYFGVAAEDLLVLDVSVAPLRNTPSRDAPAADRVHRGAIVRKLGVEGDWMRVKTRWDNVGYIPASHLRAYSPSQ